MKKIIINGIEYTLDKDTNIVLKHERHFLSEKSELKRYDTHNNSMDDSKYVNYFNTIIHNFIQPHLKEGTILDFGSGQARILEHLLAEKSISSYDLFYFPNTDLLQKKYDNIVLIETVEHFQNPISQFAMVVDLLNSNGRLIIQTLFKPQLNEFNNWWYKNDTTHVSFYDLKAFKYIAKKFNLEIVYTNLKNEIVLKKK